MIRAGLMAVVVFSAADLLFATPASKPARAFPPYASKSFVPGVNGRRTGFFHCEQIDGRWWTIDPLGRGMVVLGCDGITYKGPYCEALRLFPYGETTKRKYPNKEAWNAATISRLTSWGFNMLGNCRDEELFRRGIAHAISLGVGRELCLDFDHDETWIGPTLHLPSTVFPNVFHPAFREHCRKVAAERCAPNRDDPWLFGYFLDNELCWNGWKSSDFRGSASKSTHVHEHRDPVGGMFDTCLAKRPEHTARQAVEAFLDRTYGKGKRPAVISSDVKLRFLELVADTYFSTVAAAIREADPNHMILGARFDGLSIRASKVRPEVWRAAGKVCDLLSFNCYPWADLDCGYVRRAMPDKSESLADLFTYHYEIAKKPLLITEWSFPAMDAGLPCLFGAGQRVPDQATRVQACELMAKTVLSLPFMVGYDYFKWNDQCALGNSRAFPEDSNYGLVNVKDEPYAALTAMFAKLHAEAGRWRMAPTPVRKPSAADSRLSAASQRANLLGAAANDRSVTCKRAGDAYEVSNGAGMVWRGKVGGADAFDEILLGLREIGSLGGMLAWFDTKDRKHWAATTRVKSVDWNASTSTLQATLCGADGATAFELDCAYTFAADRPQAFVEICNVRNVGKKALRPYLVYFRQHASYENETPSPSVLRLNPVCPIWKGFQKTGWFAEDGRYCGAATVAPSAASFVYRCGKAPGRGHCDAGFTFEDGAAIAPGEAKSFDGFAHALLFAGLDGVDGFRRAVSALGTPRLRFGVLSDIHIGGRKEAPVRLAFALRWLDAHGADAVLSPGDIAHNGFVWQIEKFAELWKAQFPNGRAKDGRKVELMISTGNHDAWEGKGRLFDGDTAARTWKRLFNETFEPVWRKEVKGYTFIGAHWPTCHPDIEGFMSGVGPTLDRSKPFFYCQHEHPLDTCHGDFSNGCDKGQSVRALSPYPNAVAFSGHSHCAVSDERTVWQGAFTSIGSGCLHEGGLAFGYDNCSAFWHSPSKTGNIMAPLNDREQAWGGDPDGACFLFVEVFDDFIIVHRRSSIADEAIGPAWTVPIPARAGGPFDFARRTTTRTPPEFPADAVAKATFCPRGHALESKWRAGEPCVAVDFPAARACDGCRVFTYEITARVGDKVVKKGRIFAPDFALPVSHPSLLGTILFARKDLPTGEDLTFDIVPRECFGKIGRAISCRLKALPAD